MKKRERGSVIDLLASMVVLFFMFALLLAYLSYSSAIRQKMALDLAAKNALYQMEETGCWTDEIEANFLGELSENGINGTIVSNQSSKTKVVYGTEVIMDIGVQIPNPLHKYRFMQIFHSPTIVYHIVRGTTAKW